MFRAECQRRLPEPHTKREQRILRQVGLTIADLQALDTQGRVVRHECAEITFQGVRDVLSLTPRGQRQCPAAGLSAEAAAKRLQAIAADLQRYREQLRE